MWLLIVNELCSFTNGNFLCRSTMTPDRHLERVLEHLEQDLQQRVEPGDIVPSQRTWRRRRGLAPDEFRVNIYNQNLWVTSLPSVGLPRDVSPQNFRCVPMMPSSCPEQVFTTDTVCLHFLPIWQFHFHFHCVSGTSLSVRWLLCNLQYILLFGKSSEMMKILKDHVYQSKDALMVIKMILTREE